MKQCMTILLAFALCVCAGAPARAQAGLLGPGAAFLGIGASGVATDQLDDRLSARGYPTMGGTGTAFSLGVYRILGNRVMLGAEWTGVNIGHGTRAGRDVDLGGGYGTVGVGYMLPLSPRTRIYPRIGLGGGGIGLWFESDSSEVAFDAVLADPQPVSVRREPVLSRGGVVIDLGAGAEFLLRGPRSGLLLGLRFGYLAAPSSNDWRLYDSAVPDGPDATLAGPYIRATVGVGWSR